MGCCEVGGGIGRFFSRFSGRYIRRYERTGLEATQRQLLAALEGVGIKDKTLLEIGCGVGYLHQYLLARGAQSAVGIDLSAAMLKEAQALAVRKGLADRVRYEQGDFRDMASGVDRADITLLDRVICCYPDAEGLLAAATSRTKVLCALTFPRDHRVNRLAVWLASLFLQICGSSYRPFVHDPSAVDMWIRGAGFRRVADARTPLWITRAYQRL